MRTFFKNIIVTVVLVLSLFSFETKGQIGSVYPVDLNVMLTPPYGTCLTDLSNSNRFVIQALLRDMNHGNNYEMLIQMRVKSLSSMNTVFLSYSNKFSIGMGKPAVVLGAGNTPVSISNFFESGNVLIGQNILNDNCLPEGAYLFCFQAFDAKAYYAKQRIPISKEFTITAFLENGATPILISPANNDSLSCQLPNVIFQWQQPYITSGINSYTLQVAEANSPFDGPQIIENGGNLLIEKRGLMMPICDIPVTEANFKENHTYYWRVVMCDKDGKARASYPNKGASPVYKFVYCGTPQEPEPEDAWVPQIPMAKSIKKSLDRLRIDTVLSDESSCSAYWFQDPVDVREKYDGVVIEVKKKNQDTWTPFLMESKVATDTLVALSSLAYKETYMARGQYFFYEDGEKVYAPYSDTIEFKIPHPADTLECGNAAPELTDCTNAGERAELEIGDEFNANGTTVSIDTITYQSVNGSSVIISGEGHLPFPILSKFGLKVSFDNIEINCADELKKGQVISVYDEKTAAMIDLNNILGKGAAGNDLKQEDASLTEVGPDDDLSGFKSGDLIVEDGKVSLIVGNGNVVQVGTVIDLSNSDAYNDNGALNDEDIYVKFSNPDHENIAFDDDPTGMIRRAATLSDKYVSYGEEYIIPWVATNPGRIFQLTATPSKDLSKSGFTDVKFVLPASGTHVVLDAVENGDGSYSVSIPGMKVDVQNQVYAIARKGEGSPYENVGKLNLCCYSYKSKKVVIVPLLEGLSVNTDEVKKDLDRVYAKLGYTFEVELDDDAAHREGLSTTIGLETDFLSDFSDEMKELIFNYEINIGDAYDKDAAYLFLLDKPTGRYKDAAGIMPQRQQYGFIFMREVTSATPSITHTMAHELGHGIFGLDHIFSGAYGIKKGATYNLMDYTEKTPNDALSYHEWTQINRPLPSWSALSRAEEDMWLKSPILTRKLMRDICLSYKNKEIVNQSNKYIVPEKECRITKYKQNGYEFIYFYKSKEEAEKYLNDNNELNDKTYALNVIEDQKGTTQKIDAMLSSNLKTCPNVFDEDDDEDFILELLRKIKLANKFGEDLTLPFGSAEKDASEITLPNGSIITDVEVVVNKNSVSLKAVKTEHEWEIGFSDSVFCFGVSDETEQYPLQISCNAGDAEALRKYLGLKVSAINSMPVQPIDHYIVSVDDATIRKSEDRTKFENKNIPMGTEVVIVSEETVKGKVVAYVKLVDTVPELFYYTTKSNLTKIEVLEKPEDWRLLKDIESVKLPFSSILTKQIHVVGDYEIVAKCGNFLCISNGFFDNLGLNEGYLGYWVDCSNMIKIVELPKTIEERKIKIEKSVVDVTNRINTKTKKAEGVGPQACNMCTRTALYYLTGDPVLFPRTGSRIHFTFDKTTDPEIKGNVSGYGKAADIISDLRAGILDDYFEEIEKKTEESFLSYWERLQNYADEGEIIIGAYGTNHVFMIVPGGMIPVVDNSSHTQGGLLKESYKTNPSISDGDKYGFSFNARKILFVNRILECGTTVKDANAPVYANMDYRGYTGETKKINFYKYKKK